MENGEQVSTDKSYTFTVDSDCTLTAVFEEIPVYTITVTIDPAGSGTVAGAGQYKEGETCTLAATVSKGYAFVGWQENGATVSTDEKYSFAVTCDRTLVSLFEVYSRLPVGYTELEYLHSKGNIGFDTGVSIDFKKIRATMDVYVESHNSAGTTNGILSAPGNSTSGSFSCYLYNSTIQFRMGASYGTNTGVNAINNRLTIDADLVNRVFKVGGVSKTFRGSTTQGGNVGILSVPTGTSPTCKLYSFKIYNSGTLIKDYVPFIDSSGKVGLFDLVGNSPIYNSNTGSGTLTAGPAV